MRKLRNVSSPLSEASEKVFVGLQTSADDVYILERLGEEDDRLRVRSKRTKRNYLLEKALLKPLLRAANISVDIHRLVPAMSCSSHTVSNRDKQR